MGILPDDWHLDERVGADMVDPSTQISTLDQFITKFLVHFSFYLTR